MSKAPAKSMPSSPATDAKVLRHKHDTQAAVQQSFWQEVVRKERVMQLQ